MKQSQNYPVRQRVWKSDSDIVFWKQTNYYSHGIFITMAHTRLIQFFTKAMQPSSPPCSPPCSHWAETHSFIGRSLRILFSSQGNPVIQKRHQLFGNTRAMSSPKDTIKRLTWRQPPLSPHSSTFFLVFWLWTVIAYRHWNRRLHCHRTAQWKFLQTFPSHPLMHHISFK